MSAIRMTCENCGAGYMAGMVGSTPWPPHHCAVTEPGALSKAIGLPIACPTCGNAPGARHSKWCPGFFGEQAVSGDGFPPLDATPDDVCRLPVLAPETEATTRLVARVEELTRALAAVLEWPLPEGTVETWALPQWLAESARAALEVQP